MPSDGFVEPEMSAGLGSVQLFNGPARQHRTANTSKDDDQAEEVAGGDFHTAGRNMHQKGSNARGWTTQ